MDRRLALWSIASAAGAVLLVVMYLALAVPSLQGTSAGPHQEADLPGVDHLSDEEAPEGSGPEPTLPPQVACFVNMTGSSFVSDYLFAAIGGDYFYFQNVTVCNGTANTTFPVDARWSCIFVYIYAMGPIEPSAGDIYVHYHIYSLEGLAGSGGIWNQSADGGSGDIGYLYNDGPYGDWAFDITVQNGSAIVLIQGVQSS